MSPTEIVRRATSRAGIIRVSNALNPILWACALSPTMWIFAYLFRDDGILRYGLVALGALPWLGFVSAYFFLLATDRNRLQSEEFVLRQQELAIIERKSGGPLPVDTDLSADIHRLGTDQKG